MLHTLVDWTGYWIVRGTAFVAQRLSLQMALALGRRLGGTLYYFSSRRRVAYANLKAAIPFSTARERKRWARGTYEQLGMTAIEMMRSPYLTKEEIGRRIGTGPDYEEQIRHRQSGKGSIFLTAHIGNWELSQIVEGLRGRPLMVLARKQKYRRLDGLLNAFRQYHGAVPVGKGVGTRDLIRTLREGGCVGILGDQSSGDDGVWVRFFGRLTPAPRGPMALALKLGVRVIPVVMVRRGTTPYHDLTFHPEFQVERTGDRERDIQTNTQRYLRLLESYISKYPAQWLWGHKRWKRTRTKRIVILSDGKPGHVKQSETLVKEVIQRGKLANPPYEIRTETIEVKFRSALLRILFPVFAFFFIPWAQGRLLWLRFFFTRETAGRIERTGADLVVSAGASLVPLNLCLARENLAKSAVVMKPSFPFNFSRYDLVLIPAHDRGVLPASHFRIQGALSGMDEENLRTSREKLGLSLRDPARVRVSVFFGGETHRFRPFLSDARRLAEEVDQACARLDGDYLITTSRRTPREISDFFRQWAVEHPRCQLCVIATEDPRPEVVPGMMALAGRLVVTEDSLSMISEALSSGKSVVVARMTRNGLPRKHIRFQEILKNEWGVPVVTTEKLSETLLKGGGALHRVHLEKQQQKIRERLETFF